MFSVQLFLDSTARRSHYSWHHHRTMGSKGNQPTIDKHNVVTKNMRKTFSQPNVTMRPIEFRSLQVPWLTVSGCRRIFLGEIGRDSTEAPFFPIKSQCQAHTAHQMWWVWWGSRDELNNLTVTWLNGVVPHWCPCCHLNLAPSQGGGFRQMMEAHTSEERDMDVDVDVCWGPNDSVPSPLFFFLSRDVAIWLFNTLICRICTLYIANDLR